ncbi:MAG: hypothetical protein R2875_14585 [Desulfobacterales bacterium]
MPGALIKSFVADCEKVLVVEEGEPYMEEAVKALAQEAGYTGTIKGKAPDLFSGCLSLIRLWCAMPGRGLFRRAL